MDGPETRAEKIAKYVGFLVGFLGIFALLWFLVAKR
jgi:hypothetical protein